jgi:ligand-binding sensor domain-containing protein
MKEALRDKKYRIAAVLILLAALSVAGSFFYQIGKARKTLLEVKKEAADHSVIVIDSRNFSLAPDPQAQILSNPYTIRKLVAFQDRVYAATTNGLVTFSAEGKELDHWTTLEGLPSQDLTALAVFNDSLWIGTSDSGLIRYKDREWTYFSPKRVEFRFIRSLLATSQGRLLIGTDAGILAYDGQHFVHFIPALKSEKITALAGSSQNLFIGTFAAGLYQYEAGVLSHYGRDQGLRDPYVTDLQTNGLLCYVSTADGIQILEKKAFRTLANQMFITSFIIDTPDLWAATRDRGVVKLANKVVRASRPQRVVDEASAPRRSPSFITKLDTSTIAFNGSEISVLRKDQWKQWSSPKPLFSDANVSSLLKTRNGELWIGYFDQGLDVLSASKDSITHYKDENLFCVNHISEDGKGRVYVSTSNGLVVFEPNRIKHVYRIQDGLLSDRVMQTLPLDADGKEVAIATTQGFTLKEGANMKSIFAFHGLVNNHIYTMAADGPQLFLGTLGGISRVSHMQVAESWTQMDSGLKRNWVNAMVSINNQLFVGTYGSGIQVRTDSGQWLDFPALPEDLEINPNALYYDGSLLFCGTLDRGIYIYNTQNKSWKHVSQGLPSSNVTSFAADGDLIYIGTDRGLLQIKYDKISTIPDLI